MLLAADPKANYLAHKEAIDAAVKNVLEGGWYILGKEVSGFEQEFAGFVGAAHAVGVGSGTEALHLALRACGVGPGDAVVTVSHTAVATVAAIDLAGATPILVDVDPDTYTLNPARLEAAVGGPLRGKIKAVVPVHLYGHPADMPAIMEIARQNDLFVIEDCAQSHGASIGGKQTGAWGHFGAFSFYPTKNLGALGDGGALVSSDADLAKKAELLRQYGWRERYISDMPGMNTRLDELQAAILRVKLPYLHAENARRRRLAALYDDALSGSSLIRPVTRPDVESVYHQYTVRHARRDDLKAFLHANGVGTAVLYPMPVHLQPGYRERVVIGPGGLEHTERLCREILSLPVYPELTEEQVCGIGAQIADWDARRESFA